MAEEQLTVYGTPWCSDCKRTKQFLGEQRVPYSWVDVDRDRDGLEKLETLQNGGHTVPMIIFADGSFSVEPSNAELAARLGISTRAKCNFYDVVIVGGGPAGLTAALYTAREGYSTLVIERAGLGGQAAVTERLDNFPGFPEGVTGQDFAERLVKQAHKFEVETISAQAVTDIEREGDYRLVRTESGHEYTARAVLIASGSRYKTLDVPGEKELLGTSIHYCATCDGPFYRDKMVAVVGGGNSAAEEGVFLTAFASHVTLLVRGSELGAGRTAQEKVEEGHKLDVRYNSEVVEFRGEDELESVVVRDIETGEVSELEPRPEGVFVFIGLSPNSDFLPSRVERDGDGFVVTSPTLETSFSGVFAAGDVRAGSTKQAASASGEGATAALMIRDYLRRTG